MSNKETGSLRDRIRRMLSAEFEGLTPDAVAGVLSGLASELHQMSEAGVALSEIDSFVTDEPAAPLTIREDSGAVDVEARGDAEIARILSEVIGVGAIVLPLEKSPALNDLVDLRLRLPTLHLEVVTQGRVVHSGPQGTAIEVSALSTEDRAALEKVWPDFQNVGSAPAKPAEADHPKKPEMQPAPDKSVEPEKPKGQVLARVSQTISGMRASDSVPIPALASRRTGSFRRRIDLTDPDVKVISSTQMGIKALSTREFYGPPLPWIEPTSEPDREELLADDRVNDILLQLSQDAITGMAVVSTGGDEDPKYQVLLDSGFIVEVVRSPRDADVELGPMLYKADRITKQQLAMTAAHADEHGNSVERSLLELGILDPERIRQAIAGRLTYLLNEISNLTSGKVEIYEGASLPAGFLPTPPLRVHMAIERILFKRYFEDFKAQSLKDREATMRPQLESYPEIVPEESERVDRTLTEEEHVQLLENVISGRKRLQEVITESGISHADTYAVVYTLHRMGLLRFDHSLHQTVVRERYRENVTVKYLSVHKASYFEVLNVHWSSYDDAIQKAYDELVQAFDPAQVPENLESEVHQRVSEIRDRVESAYQVLSSRDTRHAYRKRIMPEYKLAHAIPLFLKQGELAEKRRQWEDAMDSVKRVLEIDPENKDAKYRAERLVAIMENRLSPEAGDSSF